MNQVRRKRNRVFEWAPNPAEDVLSSEHWDRIAAVAELTPREQQVTELLFNGQTRQEIADALGLKVSTVRHHLQQIYTKLQVTTRVGVALRVISIRDQLHLKQNR